MTNTNVRFSFSDEFWWCQSKSRSSEAYDEGRKSFKEYTSVEKGVSDSHGWTIMALCLVRVVEEGQDGCSLPSGQRGAITSSTHNSRF